MTFTPDDWFKPQYISVTAIDDLVIERDHTAPLTHVFSSSDSDFDGLNEDLSVNITDNDFQRSVHEDQYKLPSDGNNKIIYDLDMSANNKWYTYQYPQGTQDPYDHYGNIHNTLIYNYSLGSGSDDLEIRGVEEVIADRAIIFLGEGGNDTVFNANFADGGTGDDELTASNVQSTFNYVNWRYYKNTYPTGHLEVEAKNFLSEDNSNVLFGASGDDILTGNIYQDILIGGTGTDTINASSGDDRIWGDGYSSIAWNGDNYGSTLARTEGDSDTIDAGDGNDWVDGGAGKDTINAGEGTLSLIHI